MKLFYSSDTIILMSFKIIFFLILLFSSPALTANNEVKKAESKVTMEEVAEFLTGFFSKKQISSGALTFQDGTKYIGSFKKNIIQGYGKFIDSNGDVSEGKWRYGKLIIKIDKKTRKVIKLNRSTGASQYFERKGEGLLSNKWFESEPKMVNVKKVNKLSELNFFDQPSAIFSNAYSEEEKILDSENLTTSSDPKNMKTVYRLTSKGKKDMRIAITKKGF